MRFTVPFRLIEISVISAQDLAPVSRSMKTYAIAWVHPDRKMTTRVDQTEIYNVPWLKKDTRVENVRVLISDIINSSSDDRLSSDTQIVALQVRLPSGRPQGILNLGVALVDNTLRSMPLCTETAPYPARKPDLKPEIGPRVELRRTNSDVTDLTTDPQQKASSVINHRSMVGATKTKGGSVVGAPKTNGGSMVSEIGPSASVVAAAISKGIYPIHLAPANHHHQNDRGSLILNNWTGKDAGVEGLKAKIEQWRTELPPVHDSQNELETEKKAKQAHRSKQSLATACSRASGTRTGSSSRSLAEGIARKRE